MLLYLFLSMDVFFSPLSISFNNQNQRRKKSRKGYKKTTSQMPRIFAVYKVGKKVNIFT